MAELKVSKQLPVPITSFQMVTIFNQVYLHQLKTPPVFPTFHSFFKSSRWIQDIFIFIFCWENLFLCFYRCHRTSVTYSFHEPCF